MLESLIIKSFFLGLISACSVGPMFILIVYRSSSEGLFSGLASSLGLAIVDGVFFGLSMMGGLSLAQKSVTLISFIEKLGSPFLIFMGIYTLLKKPVIIKNSEAIKKSPNIFWAISSSMLLTISNPLTLIFFSSISIKIFPELIKRNLLFSDIFLSAISLFLGSLTTLCVVSILAERFSHKISRSISIFSKYLSGSGFLATGIYLFFEVSFKR